MKSETRNNESTLELRYAGYGEILTAFIPAEDETWVELLRKFTDFLRGAGFNIDYRALDGVGLPGEFLVKEVEESNQYLDQVITLKQSLCQKLDALTSEKVAARLVSLADSGFKVVEMSVPVSKLMSRAAEWPIIIYDYTDKINIKHGKADTEIKFILELGNEA